MKFNELKNLLVILILSYSGSCLAIQNLEVLLDEDAGHVGKYMLGVHFVYHIEEDSIYSGDWFAKWAQKAGVSTARFPGGTALDYWDWENPLGRQKVKTPGLTQAPSSEWMSLDEYLHFVTISRLTPLIGIDILSDVHAKKANLAEVDEKAIRRTGKQVRYLVSKGFKNAFYYLGNEDINKLGGLEKAAMVFVRHAKEIRSIDPSAKLFWNDNKVNPERLEQFLLIAGKFVDGVELHGKWPYGGLEAKYTVTTQDWQQQYPLREDKGTYSDIIVPLRKKATELGFPNLMFANNEYGLAVHGAKKIFIGYNRFQYSLVILDILHDLFAGGYDMACLWSNVAPPLAKIGKKNKDVYMQRLIDVSNGNRLNPMHFGFELLSSAQGGRLLKMKGTNANGYGFAVRNGKELEIFLLNKSNSDNQISIQLNSKIDKTTNVTKTTLVDTPDHWGKLVDEKIVTQGSKIVTVLPSLSYTNIIVYMN